LQQLAGPIRIIHRELDYGAVGRVQHRERQDMRRALAQRLDQVIQPAEAIRRKN
jgi:hypothetical protein